MHSPAIEKMLIETPGLRPLIEKVDFGRIPRHIAIIMDGNGRWAKSRSLPRTAGHYEGVNSVRRAVETASDMGVGYLTLYAFSTENWNRPKEEVDALMHLIGIAIEQQLPDLIRNNVRIRLVGAISRMPEEASARLHNAVEKTSACTGMTLAMCLSYSARWELTEAARQIARRAAEEGLDPADITEETIAAHLDTAGMPDPDLLIRTGGECRVSNFLLWQIAYSELHFSPVLWPDFSRADLIGAIVDFQNRERRFGKTSEQVAPSDNTDR